MTSFQGEIKFIDFDVRARHHFSLERSKMGTHLLMGIEVKYPMDISDREQLKIMISDARRILGRGQLAAFLSSQVIAEG